MKMRSKRDRRPLLTQDVRILSDQMSFDRDEGNPASGTINKRLHENGKKAPWKRIFGKGNGAKRQQDENLPLHSDFPPSEHSYSSPLTIPTNPENSHEQLHTQMKLLQPKSGGKNSSNGSSVMRDDQNLSSSDKQVADHTTNKKDMPQSSSTKSQSNNRNKSRSFLRSLKKKSAQAISSPTSAANGPVTQPQIKGEIQNHGIDTSSSYATNSPKQSPGKINSEQPKRTPPSVASSSFTSLKDISDSAQCEVKKVLSKPFGREHILTTEQIVSERNILTRSYVIRCIVITHQS